MTTRRRGRYRLVVGAVSIATAFSVLSCSSSGGSPSETSDETDGADVSELTADAAAAVVSEYVERVFRAGDAESALPLTCGYLRYSTSVMADDDPSEYRDDSPLEFAEPQIVEGPGGLSMAVVEMREPTADEDGAGYFLLIGEDGEWKVCDLTSVDRMKSEI